MENDLARAEKAHHVATYETATCHTRVRVCECVCVRVCIRVCICACVRTCVIACVKLRRKHTVKDFG